MDWLARIRMLASQLSHEKLKGNAEFEHEFVAAMVVIHIATGAFKLASIHA